MERLQELEQLAEAATPGPWHWNGDYSGPWPDDDSDPEPNYWRCWQWLPDVNDVAGLAIVDTEKAADAEFIAAARTAVPELTAEVRVLRSRLQTVEAENAELKQGCNCGCAHRRECPKYAITGGRDHEHAQKTPFELWYGRALHRGYEVSDVG